MVTDAALIQKLRVRMEHYVVQARWKRARRVQRWLRRIEERVKNSQNRSRSLTA